MRSKRLSGRPRARQHVIGHLRAGRRQTPIVVGRRSIGVSIGVAAHHDQAGARFEQMGERVHRLDHLGLRFGRAEREHRVVELVGQRDQQAFVGRFHVDRRPELLAPERADLQLQHLLQARGLGRRWFGLDRTGQRRGRWRWRRRDVARRRGGGRRGFARRRRCGWRGSRRGGSRRRRRCARARRWRRGRRRRGGRSGRLGRRRLAAWRARGGAERVGEAIGVRHHAVRLVALHDRKRVGRGRPGDDVEAPIRIGEQHALGHGRLRTGGIAQIGGGAGLARVGRDEAVGRVDHIALAVWRQLGLGLTGHLRIGVGRDAGRGHRRRRRAVAVNALGRARGFFQFHRIEVARDDRLGVLVGGADDPQHQEERHHRRHEIGEGDLPGAAVVLLLVAATALDDDDLGMRVLFHGASLPRQRFDQIRPRLQRGADRRILRLDRHLDAALLDILDVDRQIGDAFA